MAMKIICPIFLGLDEGFDNELNELENSSCDMIEIRLDNLYEDAGKDTVIRALDRLHAAQHPKPFIYTLRTEEEGGEAHMNDAEYADLTARLYNYPGYVDVQLERLKRLDAKDFDMSRTFLSYHNFDETPDIFELSYIWQDMDEYHPKTEKISVMPKNDRDVQVLLTSCRNHQTECEKAAISMGEKGKISRILGDLFGSNYSFASHITSSAPGQPSLEDMAFYRSAINNRGQ